MAPPNESLPLATFPEPGQSAPPAPPPTTTAPDFSAIPGHAEHPPDQAPPHSLGQRLKDFWSMPGGEYYQKYAADDQRVHDLVAHTMNRFVPFAKEISEAQPEIEKTKIGKQAIEMVQEQLAHPEQMVMTGEIGAEPLVPGEMLAEGKSAGKQLLEAGREIVGRVKKNFDEIPGHLEHKYAYRSRDVGEEGVPSGSPAQATMDEAEAHRIATDREKITGKPQEVVKIPLHNLASHDYTARSGPRGSDWVQFHRDLSEHEVEGISPTVEEQTAPKKFTPSFGSKVGEPPPARIPEPEKLESVGLHSDDRRGPNIENLSEDEKAERAETEQPTSDAAPDYKSAAEKSGVEFRGVQEGIKGEHPGLAIFQDPKSGTSVAVRLDQWSPEKLQDHVDAARERMAPKEAAEKPALEYDNNTGTWATAKGNPVARMDVNSLGFMTPDGQIRVAPERTMGFDYSIYQHSDMFENAEAMRESMRNGGVRFGRTPGTSRDAYVSIAKTDPITLSRAKDIINQMPVDDFFFSVESPTFGKPQAEFNGTAKEVIHKINQKYRESTQAAHPKLPPQPKLPDTGTHAAIRTDDGSIYPDMEPEKQRTHVMFAQDLGIPADRIVSGGWLKDGDYEGSERSDAGRYGERARAQKTVAETRTQRKLPRTTKALGGKK